MKLKSFAKVNLYLKVKKKKGILHKINSVFTIVEDLYDEITIVESNKSFDTITCNIKELEKNNFIFQVLNILREEHVITKYYKIDIKKNIPLGSGMGGGSSNAVTVIKYFSNSKRILKRVAKEIGSDCYYFISGYHTAKVKGYGDKIKEISSNKKIYKSDLIFTNINCNTSEVYKKFDDIKAWKNKYENNMLEIPAIKLYPNLADYREYGQMTGSGSTFIKKTSLRM
ncbi:4-diphosphocytidyl-2C-methyl-D-erythritol kinase [Spiroplasma diminutum]|uniref:4-diphosphocytidyl-2-C-methyl-D-erythritol kinase n=1 Tax=Spiroplasma diminutum CUAS-1 TaxID=1276221 RepID=S5MKP2_9MOLU|nr:4-diphosphocytidyl-2C-methyl-D-erythritol kinase [Spiroplasma diminutum]AGR42545.1 4-diphosphocytidyl-2-C-methyl-D-erythritol kinase [Spiroplasma diminutum CUAS-1]